MVNKFLKKRLWEIKRDRHLDRHLFDHLDRSVLMLDYLFSSFLMFHLIYLFI